MRRTEALPDYRLRRIRRPCSCAAALVGVCWPPCFCAVAVETCFLLPLAIRGDYVALVEDDLVAVFAAIQVLPAVHDVAARSIVDVDDVVALSARDLIVAVVGAEAVGVNDVVALVAEDVVAATAI
jgi:hypothetical protein